jgi:hypothetical protein
MKPINNENEPPAPSATPRKWNTEYHRELDYSERLAKEYKAKGDTHGMNFHQGRASELISVDIMAGQIFDALEQDLTAALTRAEQAESEVKRLTDKCIDMFRLVQERFHECGRFRDLNFQPGGE